MKDLSLIVLSHGSAPYCVDEPKPCLTVGVYEISLQDYPLWKSLENLYKYKGKFFPHHVESQINCQLEFSNLIEAKRVEKSVDEIVSDLDMYTYDSLEFKHSLYPKDLRDKKGDDDYKFCYCLIDYKHLDEVKEYFSNPQGPV